MLLIPKDAGNLLMGEENKTNKKPFERG